MSAVRTENNLLGSIPKVRGDRFIGRRVANDYAHGPRSGEPASVRAKGQTRDARHFYWNLSLPDSCCLVFSGGDEVGTVRAEGNRVDNSLVSDGRDD